MEVYIRCFIGIVLPYAFNPTIVHHDIKPANVLIDDNKNYAITDFGISSHRGLNRKGYDESQIFPMTL